jgi:hypothetical protein
LLLTGVVLDFCRALELRFAGVQLGAHLVQFHFQLFIGRVQLLWFSLITGVASLG